MKISKLLHNHLEKGEKPVHQFLIKQTNHYYIVVLIIAILLFVPIIFTNKDILILYIPFALVLFISISFFTKRDFAKKTNKIYVLTNRRLLIIERGETISIRFKQINRVTATYKNPNEKDESKKKVTAITVASSKKQIVVLKSLEDPNYAYKKMLEVLYKHDEKSI